MNSSDMEWKTIWSLRQAKAQGNSQKSSFPLSLINMKNVFYVDCLAFCSLNYNSKNKSSKTSQKLIRNPWKKRPCILSYKSWIIEIHNSCIIPPDAFIYSFIICCSFCWRIIIYFLIFIKFPRMPDKQYPS